MKITRSIYFIFILSIYLITACTQNTTPEATQDNGALIEKITTEPQCQLPCWRGIVPGETSMDEAYDLLQAWTDVKHLTQYSLDYAVIEWTFTDSIEVGKIEAGFGGNKNTVRRIYFNITNQPVMLDQIVASFGDPGYLFFCKNVDWDIYYLEAVYPEQNMVIDLGTVSTIIGRVKLSGDELVNSIAIIAPYYFNVYYPLPTETEHTCALTWEGYGTYKFTKGRVGK